MAKHRIQNVWAKTLVDELNSLSRFDDVPNGWGGRSIGLHERGDYIKLEELAEVLGLEYTYWQPKALSVDGPTT